VDVRASMLGVVLKLTLFSLAAVGSALGLLCLIASGYAMGFESTLATQLTVAATVAYLGGSIGITVFANVPLNNRLARLSSTDSAATAFWSEYLAVWTRWNTVRAVASLLAGALFAVAIGL
jgi:uncharacterized membrane protein